MSSAPKVKTTTPVATSVFSALDLFRDLLPSRLLQLQQQTKVREFPAGHVFFEMGGTSQTLFLLEKGRVQTFRRMGRKS